MMDGLSGGANEDVRAVLRGERAFDFTLHIAPWLEELIALRQRCAEQQRTIAEYAALTAGPLNPYLSEEDRIGCYRRAIEAARREGVEGAGTLALVHRWSVARDEAWAAVGTPGHDAAMTRFRAWQSELVSRGVDLYSLARAIDRDASRR